MTFDKIHKFIDRTFDHLRYDGVSGLQWPLWTLYNESLIKRTSLGRFGFRGSNVYEREWDVLILLDACRVDLLQAVSDHDLLADQEIRSTYSVASDSHSFLERTFNTQYSAQMANTALITANPHTELTLDSSMFQVLDEVWRYSWDEEIGTVPARAVTDRAITTMRDGDFNRVIIHYMQPHFPSVPNPELGSTMNVNKMEEGSWSNSIWDRLFKNQVSHEAVWEAYADNLEYVLDEVGLLLSNVDAENVVISADHGNAMGERSFYGHANYPVRQVWEVPWIATDAEDSSEYEPSLERQHSGVDNLKEKLSSLGYV